MATIKNEVFCDYCHLKFGGAEVRLTVEGSVYHQDCNKKRIRTMRIHEFFLLNKVPRGIIVVPKGQLKRR